MKTLDVRRFDEMGTIFFEGEDVPKIDGMLAHVEDRTGFLRIPNAKTARVGVQQYADADGNTWGEYRDESEVFSEDSLASMSLNVMTNDHPRAFVTAENVRDVQVGSTGTDARRDGDFLVQSLVITNADAIAAVKAGKRQLSRGYFARLVQDNGVAPDGQPFTVRQTQIRGNHLAIVDRGRAGPECGILLQRGDGFTTTQETRMKQPEETPEPVENLDAGLPFDVPDDEDEDKTEEDSEMKPQDPTPSPDARADAADAQIEKLQAKLDALEAASKTRADSETARIDARVNLVTEARSILGTDAKTDGVSDLDIMRAVILKVNPGLQARLDANASSEGYVRASFDACVDLHADRASAELDSNRVIFDAMHEGSERSTLDDEYSAYLDRYTFNADKARG